MANQIQQLQISMTVYNSLGLTSFLQSISKITNWCSLFVSQNGVSAYCYGDLPYSDNERSTGDNTRTWTRCITTKLIIDSHAMKLNHVPTEVGGKKIQYVHIFIKNVLNLMQSFNGIFQSQGYSNGSIKIKFQYVAGYVDEEYPKITFDHIWIQKLIYQKIDENQPNNNTKIIIPVGKTYNEIINQVFIMDGDEEYKKLYPLVSQYVTRNVLKYPQSGSLREDLYFGLDKTKCQQFKDNISNYVDLQEWPFIYLRSKLTPSNHVSRN